VAPNYTAPFRFTGGTIDKVVVDVSGEKFVDPEKTVAAWFAKD
jgi:arylsulfatase